MFFAPDGVPSGAPAPTPAAEAPKAGIAKSLADLRSAFSSKQTLTADLQAAQGQILTLTSERDAARTEASNEKQRANGLQAQLDQATTEINQLTAQVTGLRGEARDASARAQETLNQLGVPAAELPPSASGTEIADASSIFASWVNAKGTEKQAIYAKNKDVIHAEAARRK